MEDLREDAITVNSLSNDGFQKWIKLSIDDLPLIRPPKRHLLANVTGGLQELYSGIKKVEEKKRSREEESIKRQKILDEKENLQNGGRFFSIKDVGNLTDEQKGKTDGSKSKKDDEGGGIKEEPMSWDDSFDDETSPYTNEEGEFVPKAGMELMASRYRFVEKLAQGQSALIIKAHDTFDKDRPIAIKVLHRVYKPIGSQEADILLELHRSDPWLHVPFARLQNQFIFGPHYCLVFEFLSPTPLYTHYEQKNIKGPISIPHIRTLCVKLLTVLGFFHKQNVIHADLKPENILLKNERDMSSIMVVDFGNALRNTEEELSLYYTDFELQTLLYRSPEVIFGLKFSLEIDMWSLGCLLAECYIGQPLFMGNTKEDILTKITKLLGPFPKEFAEGECAYNYINFIGRPHTRYQRIENLRKRLHNCQDINFLLLLERLFTYLPSKRITPFEAACHPFIASVNPFLYLMSSTEQKQYPTVLLDITCYPFMPGIPKDEKNIPKAKEKQRLSAISKAKKTYPTPEAPAKVTPSKLKQDQNHVQSAALPKNVQQKSDISRGALKNEHSTLNKSEKAPPSLTSPKESQKPLPSSHNLLQSQPKQSVKVQPQHKMQPQQQVKSSHSQPVSRPLTHSQLKSSQSTKLTPSSKPAQPKVPSKPSQHLSKSQPSAMKNVSNQLQPKSQIQPKTGNLHVKSTHAPQKPLASFHPPVKSPDISSKGSPRLSSPTSISQPSQSQQTKDDLASPQSEISELLKAASCDGLPPSPSDTDRMLQFSDQELEPQTTAALQALTKELPSSSPASSPPHAPSLPSSPSPTPLSQPTTQTAATGSQSNQKSQDSSSNATNVRSKNAPPSSDVSRTDVKETLKSMGLRTEDFTISVYSKEQAHAILKKQGVEVSNQPPKSSSTTKSTKSQKINTNVHPSVSVVRPEPLRPSVAPPAPPASPPPAQPNKDVASKESSTVVAKPTPIPHPPPTADDDDDDDCIILDPPDAPRPPPPQPRRLPQRFQLMGTTVQVSRGAKRQMRGMPHAPFPKRPHARPPQYYYNSESLNMEDASQTSVQDTLKRLKNYNISITCRRNSSTKQRAAMDSDSDHDHLDSEDEEDVARYLECQINEREQDQEEQVGESEENLDSSADNPEEKDLNSSGIEEVDQADQTNKDKSADRSDLHTSDNELPKSPEIPMDADPTSLSDSEKDPSRNKADDESDLPHFPEAPESESAEHEKCASPEGDPNSPAQEEEHLEDKGEEEMPYEEGEEGDAAPPEHQATAFESIDMQNEIPQDYENSDFAMEEDDINDEEKLLGNVNFDGDEELDDDCLNFANQL